VACDNNVTKMTASTFLDSKKLRLSFGSAAPSPQARPKHNSLVSREDKNQRAQKFQESNRNTYGWLLDIKDAQGRRPSDLHYDPTSLYVPTSARNQFSDFERQFWDIKSQYFDTVVFFKKGKFYELYERDADVGHREFDLRISDNGRGAMRMAGVPEASFEEWAVKVHRSFHPAPDRKDCHRAYSSGLH
jgi:DNA mismatch repair protein MSH6